MHGTDGADDHHNDLTDDDEVDDGTEEARIGSAPNKIDTQDPDPRRRSDAAAVPAQLAASMRKKVRRFYRTGVDAVRQLAGASRLFRCGKGIHRFYRTALDAVRRERAAQASLEPHTAERFEQALTALSGAVG